MRHHAVADGSMLGAVGQGQIGYESAGQTHQPLREPRRQPRLALATGFDRVGRRSPGQCFPATDGCFIPSPSDLVGVARSAGKPRKREITWSDSRT